MGALWGQLAFRELHKAAVAAADGEILDLEGNYASVTLQVSGINGDTITLKACNDGTNWINIAGVNLTNGVAAVTIAASGLFSVPVVGIKKFKAEITTRVSGTINVCAVIAPEGTIQLDV